MTVPIHACYMPDIFQDTLASIIFIKLLGERYNDFTFLDRQTDRHILNKVYNHKGTTYFSTLAGLSTLLLVNTALYLLTHFLLYHVMPSDYKEDSNNLQLLYYEQHPVVEFFDWQCDYCLLMTGAGNRENLI